MRYILFIFSIALISCHSNKKNVSNTDSPIRYDGAYMSAPIDGNTDYLRFYQDGIVINRETAGPPGELNKWFTRDLKDVTTSSFKIEGGNVSFTLPATDNITIDYAGKIVNKETLDFHIKSTNGNESDGKYTFVEFGDQ